MPERPRTGSLVFSIPYQMDRTEKQSDNHKARLSSKYVMKPLQGEVLVYNSMAKLGYGPAKQAAHELGANLVRVGINILQHIGVSSS